MNPNENAAPSTRLPNLPERIRGLECLAYNLWWSWHRQAWELFRAIDLRAWRENDENPVRMLASLPAEVLESAARDAGFLDLYDSVLDQFDASLTSHSGWFSAQYPGARAPLAYFSAEYAFHSSLPLYAGGLGVLAGDYMKELSDLAVPTVAVGLIYSRGYITQKIRDDGRQEGEERTLDRTYDPISAVLDAKGLPLIVEVPLFDPPVHVAVWRADIGRVPVYLLDTDLEANQPWDRAIAHHLYATNPEQRLRQEIVLGMGGMCALNALGIHPAAIHINEGHPALAFLEWMCQWTEQGLSFDDALARVRAGSIFTTHTPVAAGTDVFPFSMMEKYFAPTHVRLGHDCRRLLDLGVNPTDPGAGFNMTVFALRMAGRSNAVSRRHGEVAREMWASVWPEKKAGEVPIAAVTNGVHLPTWIDPIGLQPLLDRHLGSAWLDEQDRPDVWKPVAQIPDKAFWRIHQNLKVSLFDEVNERARRRWQQNHVRAESVIAFGSLFDPEIFTIGFARRFTSYKRPDLILADLERLKRLLIDSWHPVQIVFAGKAHPSDAAGQRLIQKIFRFAQENEFGGRLAFVEDYDQELALRIVRGVDLWLNNPLPPLEASGTSGMKASVNGVPNLSILDGWWIEGYNEQNGWAFGADAPREDRSKPDAEAIYRLLEEQIVPLYYRRSDDGIPHDYVRVMKAAIETVAPAFSTRRMAKEYATGFYASALGCAASEMK
jgi:starch phosphorylase